MSHSRRDRRPISCLHSTVGVAAPARLRLVARCALVRNSLQTSCLQWVMTRVAPDIIYAPAEIRPNFHIRSCPVPAGYGRRIWGRILPTNPTTTNRLLYYDSRKAGLKTSILKHSNTITLPNKVTVYQSLEIIQSKYNKRVFKTIGPCKSIVRYFCTLNAPRKFWTREKHFCQSQECARIFGMLTERSQNVSNAIRLSKNVYYGFSFRRHSGSFRQ